MSNTSKAGRLILVRHGQSLWNVTDPAQNTTARFTGWANIGLTARGKVQSLAAGEALAGEFDIDCAVCSLLGRAQDTLNLMLPNRSAIPTIHSWRLNERHYGALVGMSKSDAEKSFGKTTLSRWRHGWEVRPPPMDEAERMEWSLEPHCKANTFLTLDNKKSVKILEKRTKRMPASESLKDTCDRVLPLWTTGLAPRLARGETLLVVAHANTVKAMLYFLDPTVVTAECFNRLKIPSALPLLYEFSKSCSINSGIPGGLVVIPPEKDSPHEIKEKNSEMRHELSGRWIETTEIKAAQFCSDVGEEHLEHEIA